MPLGRSYPLIATHFAPPYCLTPGPLHLFVSPARAPKPSEFAALGDALERPFQLSYDKALPQSLSPPAPGHPHTPELPENCLPSSEHANFTFAFHRAAPPASAPFPAWQPATCLPSLHSGFSSILMPFLIDLTHCPSNQLFAVCLSSSCHTKERKRERSEEAGDLAQLSF